jgi:hypothetical protein
LLILYIKLKNHRILGLFCKLCDIFLGLSATVDEASELARKSCNGKCWPIIYIPIYYAACMAACSVSYSASVDGTEVTPPIDIVPVPATVAVKDFSEYKVAACYDRCVATYGTSGTNYTYCVIGCSLGGRKPDDKVGAFPTPIAVSAREARSTIESCMLGFCRYLVGLGPALPPCIAVCLATGSRRRSIEYPLDEMTPVTDVDYKKVPVVQTFTPEIVDKKPVEFYVKECYDRCAVAYKPTDSDFSYCLLGCTVGGQKFDKVNVAINPFTPVRDARGLTACEKKCGPELIVPAIYLRCLNKCEGSRSLKKPLEIVPVPVVAVTEVGDFFKVCYEKCVAAYGLSGPDFASCLFKCTIGGGNKKPYEKDVVVKPVVGVREARYSNCVKNCLDKFGGLNTPGGSACALSCNFRKLEDTPVKYDDVKDYVGGGQKVQDKVIVTGVEPVAPVRK